MSVYKVVIYGLPDFTSYPTVPQFESPIRSRGLYYYNLNYTDDIHASFLGFSQSLQTFEDSA